MATSQTVTEACASTSTTETCTGTAIVAGVTCGTAGATAALCEDGCTHGVGDANCAAVAMDGTAATCTNAGACSYTPGATITVAAVPAADGYYNCSCAAGFSAENCDVDVDECASSPCQNGALCVESQDASQCGVYLDPDRRLGNHVIAGGYSCVDDFTDSVNCVLVGCEWEAFVPDCRQWCSDSCDNIGAPCNDCSGAPFSFHHVSRLFSRFPLRLLSLTFLTVLCNRLRHRFAV